jgi:hypothetical protein
MKRFNLLHVLLLLSALSFIFGTIPVQAAGLADSTVTRIHIASGATSATVSDHLAAYSTKRYVLGAAAYQLLDVILSAPEGVSLKATTIRGQALIPIQGTSGTTAFRGYLPYTGDYYLAITSGSQAVDFNLSITIPVRVSFERGATSARLDGSLAAHQGLDTILRAAQGQILEVNATPKIAGVPLQLIIYGVDGEVLRSGMGEGSSFRGELPSSQDYFVSVRAGEKGTDFTLDVIIPQVIRFSAGAFSGSVHTYLPASRTQYYHLGASKGQSMQVAVTPGDNLQLSIYGADGTVLKSGIGETASFDGKLPSTQDYILAVKNLSQAQKSYTLSVTIR